MSDAALRERVWTLLRTEWELALELAKSVGAPVILSSIVRQMYQTLIVKGYGKKNTSIIVALFEELMGSGEIKAKAEH